MDLPELDDKALAEVVRTVTGRYPGTLSAASGIVEIDVDALDALTLRQLRAIVRRSKPEDSAASPPNGASPLPSSSP